MKPRATLLLACVFLAAVSWLPAIGAPSPQDIPTPTPSRRPAKEDTPTPTPRATGTPIPIKTSGKTPTPSSAPVDVSPATPTPQPQSSGSVIVRVNTGGDGLFIRRSPGGEEYNIWPDGTELSVIGQSVQSGGLIWQNVRDPNGDVGWVAANYVVVTSGQTASAAVGPPSSGTTTMQVANTDGLGLFLRQVPSGDAITVLPEGTLVHLLGPSSSDGENIWQSVSDPDGNLGWVVAGGLIPAPAAPMVGVPSQPTATPTPLSFGQDLPTPTPTRAPLAATPTPTSPARPTGTPGRGTPTATGSSGRGTPTPTPPTSSEGTSVDVVLSEWSVTADPDEVQPGPVTFNVSVAASRLEHELNVVKSDLAPDALPLTTAGTGVDEQAAGDLAGTIATVRSSRPASGTFHLQPGTYVLFCNIPGHYSQGMVTTLTVR